MTDEILQAHGEYEAARKILVGLSPCPRCNPPRSPCSPGELIRGCDIVRCHKCGGDGFLINWEDER